MQRYPKFTLQNENKYFKEGLTWSLELYNGNMSIRYMPSGYIFAHRGPAVFANNRLNLYKVLGYLTSKVTSYFFNILSPTISLSAGTFYKLPIIEVENWDTNLVLSNIYISQQDWDS